MNTKFAQLLENYHYTLPRERIALTPASPRDSARLLIYNRKRKKVHDDRFIHLVRYLPPRSVLVLNQTKVIPARFTVTKPTGGKAKLLYVGKHGHEVRVRSEKKLVTGTTLVASHHFTFLVTHQCGSDYFVKPLFALHELSAFLNHHGVTPIPFYLRHTPLKESALRRKYQTMFARIPGSIAAPTASLHFTPRLIKDLKAHGHTVKFITLHVNLGTFAPLTEQLVNKGKLHQEWYSIDRRTADFLNRAKAKKQPIIAVGTTAVRTLETAANKHGRLAMLHGATELFIREGYKFKYIDGMITNFHIPRSSLLMLVAAFVGREKLFSLYRRAIRRGYAFFSFGDGMLLY
ncbi:MAG: tRNA preQ1(34) S-adenosylmethionine ribosyltransferase-isomerase QueA [Patescibacteria group bacterium]